MHSSSATPSTTPYHGIEGLERCLNAANTQPRLNPVFTRMRLQLRSANVGAAFSQELLRIITACCGVKTLYIDVSNPEVAERLRYIARATAPGVDVSSLRHWEDLAPQKRLLYLRLARQQLESEWEASDAAPDNRLSEWAILERKMVEREAHKMHRAAQVDGLDAMQAMRTELIIDFFNNIEHTPLAFSAHDLWQDDSASRARSAPGDERPTQRRRLNDSTSGVPGGPTYSANSDDSDADDSDEPKPPTAAELAMMAGWSGQDLSAVVTAWDGADFMEAVMAECPPPPPASCLNASWHAEMLPDTLRCASVARMLRAF